MKSDDVQLLVSFNEMISYLGNIYSEPGGKLLCIPTLFIRVHVGQLRHKLKIQGPGVQFFEHITCKSLWQ